MKANFKYSITLCALTLCFFLSLGELHAQTPSQHPDGAEVTDFVNIQGIQNPSVPFPDKTSTLQIGDYFIERKRQPAPGGGFFSIKPQSSSYAGITFRGEKIKFGQGDVEYFGNDAKFQFDGMISIGDNIIGTRSQHTSGNIYIGNEPDFNFQVSNNQLDSGGDGHLYVSGGIRGYRGLTILNGSYQSYNTTFRVADDGNVSIGTNDAQGYMLNVAGTIRSQEVKIEADNWPDYVFTENYDLPSLTETESFIQTNGHLPNIPSAAEVAENGIALGEMNKKLLEKIEELTLHQIEMMKVLEKQAADIKALQGK